MATALYYETLASAVTAAQEDAQARAAVFTRPTDLWALAQDHLGYGETRSVNVELDTLKGKPTKKWFHVSIYRMDSGRYELTTYVL